MQRHNQPPLSRLLRLALLLTAAAIGASAPGTPSAAAATPPPRLDAISREPSVSLAGEWRCALDRSDAGVAGRWFAGPLSLSGRIRLPGSLQGHGLGDPVTVDTRWIGGIIDKSWFTAPAYEPYRRPGNVKIPFWLQPETYYAGPAWYQREIDVPASWEGLRIVLTLERPHWQTRVWVGDRLVGTNDALGTPHTHELGLLTPGRHRLTIRVDNRMVVDIGENSHSVSDHTQGNWNGIVGRLELSATPTAWIDDLQAYPDVAARAVRVAGQIRGTPLPTEVVLAAAAATPAATSAPPAAREVRVRVAPGDGRFEATLPLGADAPLWDEFHPALHRLTASLPNGHTRSLAFGLRDFAAAGTQFSINGRKAFLRGTLDCCNYPRTGHPPTDVDSWKRIIGIAKAHGLNLLRFHSWCPPEAAFVAADELGFFFHVEASSWPSQSTTLGDGKPVDAWIMAETTRILKAHGSHPSFVLMAAGNEPGGKKHAAYLSRWVSHFRNQDPRRLYTSGAGWPDIPENQWFCTPKPRIYAWGEGLKSRINARPPETLTDYRAFVQKHSVPVVSHEIGQWCVYPNFDEIPKYTGYLKPRNFEIFRDTLRAHGLENQARDFLIASGKLQALCYKEDIEAILRTPGIGGFELLDLHDFPGQGTALVGVLDAFWEEKGYISPAEYSRFCGPTVPLARLARRVFTTADTLEASLEVAHFGAAPLPDAAATWRLVDDRGAVAAQGTLPRRTIAQGNAIALGTVRHPLRDLRAPARYRLVVGIEGAAAENDWDLWVYPSARYAEPPATVLLTGTLDARALATLEAGGRVLLHLPPARVRNDAQQKVELGFSSIFWNTAWTKRMPPTTLGILCDPAHPALASFPTDAQSNWQWWYVVSRAGAMILDDLPRDVTPLIQVIDDWVTARKLALAFEARVRKGSLLVCSIDLDANAPTDNPVVRQLRASLLAYMSGDRFAPKVTLTEADLGKVIDPLRWAGWRRGVPTCPR